MTKTKIELKPEQVIKLLTGITCFLTAINIIIQFAIYSLGLEKEWFLLFNMDKEVNIPTLFSVILLLTCANLMQLIPKKLNRNNYKIKKKWQALRWVFIFLTLDEAFQIHEAFIIPSIKPMLPPLFTIVWVIPYSIFAIIALFYFIPLISSLPSKLKINTLLSGAIYISGALGFEIIGSFLVRTGDIRLHGISYGLISTTEEMLEMIGLIIFIQVLLKYILYFQKQKLKLNLKLFSPRHD